MKCNDFSYLIPHRIRSSIALKVIFYVGSAIIFLVALQTYINVNNLGEKLTPLVVQKLKISLINSENVFNTIAKQTHEDAKIIGAHNALTNYIDYEMLNDDEGMNEEIVKLEQFIRSLTHFKKQYQRIEIISKSGSIIHFSNGNVVEPSELHQQLFPENSESRSNNQSANSTADNAYFTFNNNQVLFRLTEGLNRNQPFTKNAHEKIYIYISNNVSSEVSSLKEVLKAENILISLKSKEQHLLAPQQSVSHPELWLTQALSNSALNLHLTVYKERKDAFLIIENMKNASLLLAFGSILVISISLLLTAKFVIDKPLKDIIRFISKDVLKQSDLQKRYQTSSIDEIGVFSDGLNKVLDKVQHREVALKYSEERLALALWGGGEGMWELNFTTNTIYLDSGSSKILALGVEAIQMPAGTFNLMIHPADIKRVHQSIETYKNNNHGVFEVEFRLLTPEDVLLWLKLKGKLTGDTNESNSESQGITGTLRDITTEKRVEQETQLYATAFNSSNNGIAILDPQFYILAVNDAFSRITGYTSDEAQGMLATFIGQHENSINPEDIDAQVRSHGYWNGEIKGKRKNNDVYIRDVDLNPVFNNDEILTHYVCVFSDITEKKKSEKALWKMANYDILTKLPNRAFFRKAIKNAINNANDNNDLIALLFIDLDKFKQVNDTLGHEAGDELLVKVAAILSKTTRKTDTVSRLGGDEFAILLEGIQEKENAEIVAKKIIAEFTQGIEIQDTPTGIGVSIGISLSPDDASNSQSLVHCADTAMYSAKTTGSNLFHFYHPTMRDHVNRRNQIEQELAIALKEDSLCLHYQPQLDINTGEIVAFEALTRWFHPELGFISPEEFIPIAEETGLIAQLGLNVFNEATKQLKEWHTQGYSQIRMAINISPKQFMLSDIHLDISNSIKSSGIDPNCLELELTESLIIEDPEKIIRMLSTLKALGIRLSIDDFGTGYSSLSYLSRFPLDILKIDKSFVQKTDTDPRVLTLTKAIIGIAYSLDLDVIAEGVETQEQLAILKELGCHYTQGYYYSPAVPAEKAKQLLESNARIVSPPIYSI